MTDALPPDDDHGPGIQLDRYGDPLPQGTRMIEYESYERVIEGLKTSADACMHLAKHEATREGVDNRRGLALKLDQCRRMCIQHAGVDDPRRASPTEFEAMGLPLPWREARDQLIEGLTQAAGGARQLATCFRIDFVWSRVAWQLETLERSIRTPKRTGSYFGEVAGSKTLLLPPGYVRH